MVKKSAFFVSLILAFTYVCGPALFSAQDDRADIRVVVNLVQLSVAVTDKKGNYVTGLRPEDFAVTEDEIPQKIATFAEGDEPTRRLQEIAPSTGKPSGAVPVPDQASQALVAEPKTVTGNALDAITSGANVFVLFDTSNYMYRGFVFAQDAIADFVRSLDNANKIALYSYSRDLSRSASLTTDRSQ